MDGGTCRGFLFRWRSENDGRLIDPEIDDDGALDGPGSDDPDDEMEFSLCLSFRSRLWRIFSTLSSFQERSAENILTGSILLNQRAVRNVGGKKSLGNQHLNRNRRRDFSIVAPDGETRWAERPMMGTSYDCRKTTKD
jgi:hypothetical protein